MILLLKDYYSDIIFIKKDVEINRITYNVKPYNSANKV